MKVLGWGSIKWQVIKKLCNWIYTYQTLWIIDLIEIHSI